MNTDIQRETHELFSAERIPIRFFTDPQYAVSCDLATGGYTTSIERFTPNSSRDHHIWKNFEHYKAWSSTSSVNEVTFTTDSWDGSGYHYGYGVTRAPFCFYNGCFGEPGSLNKDLVPFFVPENGDTEFIPPPSKLDEMLSISFQKCIPFIRKDLSILNSLYELKDVQTVPRSLKQYQRTCQTWRFWFNNLRNAWARSSSLAELVRSGADIYLQEKFNVAPLVSDISAVFRVFSEYERRLNDIMSRAGRPHIGHNSMHIMEEPLTQNASHGPVSVQQDNGTSGHWSCTAQLTGGVQHERLVFTKPSVFHYQLDYSFYYSQFQTEHARLLGILDMLGVNLNPTIIWNAIPWSFVIDWVASVSRLLDSLRFGLMDPSVCLRRALWSISRERSITLRQRFIWSRDSVGGRCSPQYNQLPTIIEKSYRRRLFNPLGTAVSLTTSGLSFIEASLASALVITSRRRKRRRR